VTIRAHIATPRGRFAATAAAALIPLLALWWLGSGMMIDLLRPGADWLAGQLHLSDSIVSSPSHDWRVDTGLERASGREVGGVLTPLPADELRRLLLGFPLFLALVIAPPRFRPARTAAIGVAVLVVVFWVSACSLLFNSVAVIVNHRSSLIMDTIPPPPFTVTRPPFSETAFFLSGLGMYLALQVVPLALPVLLWAGLNRAGRDQLLSNRRVEPQSD
jgi:hypothetical protein